MSGIPEYELQVGDQRGLWEMLNAELCEQRGEGRKHSKALRLDWGVSVPLWLSQKKGCHTRQQLASCQFQRGLTSNLTSCSQSLRAKTHTAPQNGLSISTCPLPNPLVPTRDSGIGGEGRPSVELAQSMTSSKPPEKNVTVSWDSKASFNLMGQLWLPFS